MKSTKTDATGRNPIRPDIFRTLRFQRLSENTVIIPMARVHTTIPKEQNNVVTYGSNIKATSMLLVHRVPSSMDQSVSFLNAITNGDFEITKSTLNNWTCALSDKLDPLIEEIRQGLYNSYYVNTDESPVNVNGKNYQLHNYSNGQYTLQYIHKSKSKEAMTELDFLPNYLGTLIHDH